MLSGGTPPLDLPDALGVLDSSAVRPRTGVRKHLIAGAAGAAVVVLFLLVLGSLTAARNASTLVPPIFGSLTASHAPSSAEPGVIALPPGVLPPVMAILSSVALCLVLGRRYTRKGATPAGPRDLAATWMAKGMSGSSTPVVPKPTRPARVPETVPFRLDSLAVEKNQDEVAALLRWGRQAARSGEPLIAQWLFVQALDLDPMSEEAWLWVAGTTDQPAEAIRCLRRVLQLNPNNARAIQGLNDLQERTLQEEM